MSGGNPIVVEAEGRSWHAGAGLLDSTASYVEAICSDSWVDMALSSVAVAVDTAATVVDPLGSLFAAGIGWVIDHLDPIKSWFDDLTGNPEEVMAFAATWQNVSTYLDGVRTDYLADSRSKLEGMSGPAVDAYRQHVENQGDRISTLSKVSRGISAGYDGMSMLVTFVHGLVRDALASIVGAICSYVAELVITLGAATPLVISQATTRVSALVSEVLPKIKGLTRSGQSLDDIMHTLRDILNDIPRFLGDRYSVPNHPGLKWRNVLHDNGSWVSKIPGYNSMTVAEQLRVIGLRDQYQHIITGRPDLWDKAITDAVAQSRANNANDALKAILDAVERQFGVEIGA